MRSIDIHTHVLPPELPRWTASEPGYIRLKRVDDCHAQMLRDDGTVFREIESNCWDGPTRLRECDAANVGVQVLSCIPVLFSYWAKPRQGNDLARYLNDHLAELCKSNPRRFVGLGTLPLQDPQLALRELDRCIQELGFAGVQIGSHVNDWNLSDPALFPVFERASELGAAVFVHPWDMMGEARMRRYWLPWLVGMPAEVSLAICSVIFGGVLERLPKLRIAFAHGGGAFPGTLGRIEHGFHSRPDLMTVDNARPPSAYLKRIYVDSLVHDARALRLVLDTFGADRIALGSDYPFPLGEARPGDLIDSMNLAPTVRQRLLQGTALEWLGRSLEQHEL
jgi:aminocarboxymuconate-semialdehyde decarboxylase